jgi:hypothetical protein
LADYAHFCYYCCYWSYNYSEHLNIIFQSSNGDIELVTHVIPGSNTYFDVANLDADTEYLLDFISQIGDKKNPPMKLTARTCKYINKYIQS